MATGPARGLSEQVELLFAIGTCAGLTDGQLLERFILGRDDGGEMAFESLVLRHGPMVMRVCRNLLDDPHDVHDAFQAVFLVLARKGGAIRHRESFAGWLHGVALRVAARGRAAAIRRSMRNRQATRAVQLNATNTASRHLGIPREPQDWTDVVHQEVSRLPEKYRAPIVLCYLEGLTHDEAAARLKWPVGTVRSRLARARDTLRTRLSRRGVTAPTVIGPLSNWINSDAPVVPKLITTGSTATSTVVSREITISLVRAISAQAAGRVPAAGSISASSLALFQGVSKAMFIKKLTILACALLPIGMLASVGVAFLAQKTLAQDPSPSRGVSTQRKKADSISEALKDINIDALIQQLLAAARDRVKAQKAYYEEGRITLNRFTEALKQLEIAEIRAAKTDKDRLAIRQQHLDWLKEVENREKAEVTVGRGTVADVAEATQQRLEAELDLLLRQQDSGELANLTRRVSDLERKVEQLQIALSGK
jgi:RNA polymerase sigma factor (sigma-70 family)